MSWAILDDAGAGRRQVVARKQDEQVAAGYSGRTAAQKLGVGEGDRLALLGAPVAWSLPGLPPGVAIRHDLRGRADVVLAFVDSAADLRRDARRWERSLGDAAALWVAWPRKAGGHDSDVSENLLREVLLPMGLVDVKVAAIDDDWSGLKLVRRRELRGANTAE